MCPPHLQAPQLSFLARWDIMRRDCPCRCCRRPWSSHWHVYGPRYICVIVCVCVCVCMYPWKFMCIALSLARALIPEARGVAHSGPASFCNVCVVCVPRLHTHKRNRVRVGDRDGRENETGTDERQRQSHLKLRQSHLKLGYTSAYGAFLP